MAAAGLCLLAAVLWSLPMLAAVLLALLRYGFGSLFVVGESVAVAMRQGTGADIAGTLSRMDGSPLLSAAEAGLGMLCAAAAASLMLLRPAFGAILAALSAAGAWWFGLPLAGWLLIPATLCAIAARRG